jgi:hypothetical protein
MGKQYGSITAWTMPPALPVSTVAGRWRNSLSEVARSEAAYLLSSRSALARFGASWSGSNRPPSLSDGALKQAFHKGRSHQDADRYRTRRLTGDGHAFRVTAKGPNVPLNPLECGDLIHQAVVSGRVVWGLSG